MILVGRDIEERIQGAINNYVGKNGKPKLGRHDFSIYDNCRLITNSNAACIFGEKKGIGIVDIRGSDDKKDWKMNFSTDKVVTPYRGTNSSIKVSKGFLEYYTLLRSKILSCANKYEKFIVSGHSLGSAAALLAYRDIIWHASHIWKRKIDIACVQIAGPRVYNNAGLFTFKKCQGHIYLIENGNDPVCNVPPEWQGFRHVFNTYVKIGWELPIFEIPILRLLNFWRHYPQAYLKNMKKYNRKNKTHARKIVASHS